MRQLTLKYDLEQQTNLSLVVQTAKGDDIRRLFIVESADSGDLYSSIPLHGLLNGLNSLQRTIADARVKEAYCLTALRNLIKKNDFLQLSLELANGYITEDEFDEEFSKNRERYVVELKKLERTSDLNAIGSIVAAVDAKKFTVHDVSEMFGLEMDSVENHIEKMKK